MPEEITDSIQEVPDPINPPPERPVADSIDRGIGPICATKL